MFKMRSCKDGSRTAQRMRQKKNDFANSMDFVEGPHKITICYEKNPIHETFSPSPKCGAQCSCSYLLKLQKKGRFFDVKQSGTTTTATAMTNVDFMRSAREEALKEQFPGLLFKNESKSRHCEYKKYQEAIKRRKNISVKTATMPRNISMRSEMTYNVTKTIRKMQDSIFNNNINKLRSDDTILSVKTSVLSILTLFKSSSNQNQTEIRGPSQNTLNKLQPVITDKNVITNYKLLKILSEANSNECKQYTCLPEAYNGNDNNNTNRRFKSDPLKTKLKLNKMKASRRRRRGRDSKIQLNSPNQSIFNMSKKIVKSSTDAIINSRYSQGRHSLRKEHVANNYSVQLNSHSEINVGFYTDRNLQAITDELSRSSVPVLYKNILIKSNRMETDKDAKRISPSCSRFQHSKISTELRTDPQWFNIVSLLKKCLDKKYMSLDGIYKNKIMIMLLFLSLFARAKKVSKIKPRIPRKKSIKTHMQHHNCIPYKHVSGICLPNYNGTPECLLLMKLRNSGHFDEQSKIKPTSTFTSPNEKCKLLNNDFCKSKDNGKKIQQIKTKNRLPKRSRALENIHINNCQALPLKSNLKDEFYKGKSKATTNVKVISSYKNRAPKNILDSPLKVHKEVECNLPSYLLKDSHDFHLELQQNDAGTESKLFIGKSPFESCLCSLVLQQAQKQSTMNSLRAVIAKIQSETSLKILEETSESKESINTINKTPLFELFNKRHLREAVKISSNFSCRVKFSKSAYLNSPTKSCENLMVKHYQANDVRELKMWFQDKESLKDTAATQNEMTDVKLFNPAKLNLQCNLYGNGENVKETVLGDNYSQVSYDSLLKRCLYISKENKACLRALKKYKKESKRLSTSHDVALAKVETDCNSKLQTIKQCGNNTALVPYKEQNNPSIAEILKQYTWSYKLSKTRSLHNYSEIHNVTADKKSISELLINSFCSHQVFEVKSTKSDYKLETNQLTPVICKPVLLKVQSFPIEIFKRSSQMNLYTAKANCTSIDTQIDNKKSLPVITSSKYIAQFKIQHVTSGIDDQVCEDEDNINVALKSSTDTKKGDNNMSSSGALDTFASKTNIDDISKQVTVQQSVLKKIINKWFHIFTKNKIKEETVKCPEAAC